MGGARKQYDVIVVQQLPDCRSEGGGTHVPKCNASLEMVRLRSSKPVGVYYFVLSVGAIETEPAAGECRQIV